MSDLIEWPGGEYPRDFFESPETQFHRDHDNVQQRVAQCFNAQDPENPCKNTCRFLISNDWPRDPMNDESPDVCGIDGAEVEAAGWNGTDIDSVTIEAYCPACVLRHSRA